MTNLPDLAREMIAKADKQLNSDIEIPIEVYAQNIKRICEGFLEMHRVLGRVKETCEWYGDFHQGPDNEVHHCLKVEIPDQLDKTLKSLDKPDA